MLREEAKKRQGNRTDVIEKKKDSTSVPSGTKVSGRVRDIAAKAVGVGKGSVDRALVVQRESPDEFERVKKGEVAVSKAERKVTEGKKSKREATLQRAAYNKGIGEILGKARPRNDTRWGMPSKHEHCLV